MGEIRTYAAEFADGVASLYFYAGRGQRRGPGKSLPAYFNELHLSNPWASPEMPSYVYVENGKVIGMIGVVPREMEFRGKPIVLATVSMFIVDLEFASATVAIQLLGRVLKGPQDLSWTDGASGSVSEFWKALGGNTASLYAFNWVRVLRPLGMVRSGLDRIGKASRVFRPLSAVAVPIDSLLSRMPLPVDLLKTPVSPYHAKPVGAEELLSCIHEIGWKELLKPYYSLSSFTWLMKEVAKSKVGNLRMLTVTTSEGTRCGWLVYFATAGGAGFVLQIGVRKREDFPNTLRALFRDAWEQGCVCVKGASIPQHLKALTDQHCFYRHPDNRVVVHSRNPDLMNPVRMGEATITRLDGIGWMRFSRESWE